MRSAQPLAKTDHVVNMEEENVTVWRHHLMSAAAVSRSEFVLETWFLQGWIHVKQVLCAQMLSSVEVDY